MEKYVHQLLSDIGHATAQATFPSISRFVELDDWISDEEEDRTARARELEEWTGIRREQLPPAEMLTDDQLSRLLKALKLMLDAYNCSFVLQVAVPERIEYAALRENFSQVVRVKQWHIGFFEVCRPGTEYGKCALQLYCQCAFFAELFSRFGDEDEEGEE